MNSDSAERKEEGDDENDTSEALITPDSKNTKSATSGRRERTYSRDADVSSEDEEKKKLLNCSKNLSSELVSFRNSPSRVEIDNSPSRFGTRSPWTNMSTTCEASEDEMRGRSGTSTPAEPNLSPTHASIQLNNQYTIGGFPPSNGSSGGATNNSAPSAPRVVIAPPPTMAEAAEIVRRLSQPQLPIVPLIPSGLTPMGPAIIPQTAAIHLRDDASGIQNPIPPSPDRIELKETIYTDELDPPSPGRLVLKNYVQDEPSPSEMSKRRKSLTKLNLDLDAMASIANRIESESKTDESKESPKESKVSPETTNQSAVSEPEIAVSEPDDRSVIQSESSLPIPVSRIIQSESTANENSEFEKKQLERIKIFPQKRTPGIDSPTLREIANQNAKRLRVDDADGYGNIGNPPSKTPKNEKNRNSPSFRNLDNDDKFSEAATIGDIDDLGSIASLSSINERIQETKDVEIPRPERISRPEPIEDKASPWITSLKEKDMNLSVFKQLTASRREFATRLDNYLRGCTWAPDGLCILSNSHDNILRLFNLPRGLLTGEFNNIEPEMESVLQIPEGEAVYDYAWWPLMNSMDPPTCCFVSTAKSQPIHLFDAFNGKLRATYRIINRLDEIATANSVCFSSCGVRLYAGLDGEYRIFDTQIPGKECTTISLRNQKGIISTMVSASSGVLAMGTYNKHIGIYDGDSGEQISLLENSHRGGLTQLKFIRENETYLLSGARKCNRLKCWDMRKLTEPVWEVSRQCSTNQTIQFDISPTGKMLLSGSTEGKLHFWRLGSGGSTVQEAKIVEAHRSASNAASIHPFAPICASGSGQRVFPAIADSDSEDTLTATPVSDNSLTLWTAFEY